MIDKIINLTNYLYYLEFTYKNKDNYLDMVRPRRYAVIDSAELHSVPINLGKIDKQITVFF